MVRCLEEALYKLPVEVAMKRLFTLIFSPFIRMWDTLDRSLCEKLPWYIRPHWCALWIRQDRFHPSLDSCYAAVFQKILFRRKIWRVWFNFTHFHLHPRRGEIARESLKFKKCEDKLYDKHTNDLARRRDIVRQRSETPLLK